MGVVQGGKIAPLTQNDINLKCISTHAYVALENIPFSTKALLILMISAVFAKNQHF